MATDILKKVLIVEDDEAIAETMSNTLKKLEYKVVGVVATGEEAVRETVNKHPDVVIMDVVLRGPVNGLQASKQIEEHYPVPIIFITGYRNVAAAMDANNHAALVKPFTKEDLQKAIQNALSGNE